MILTPEARSRVWPLANVVASLMLAVEGGLIGVTHGFARVGWVAAAGVTAVVQATAAWRERKVREDRLVEISEAVGKERAQSYLTLGDTLMPLLRVLTLINEETDPGEKHALEEGALQSIVAAAASSIGPPNARSCYFAMRWSSDSAPDELAYVTAHGRADQPHSHFVAGTALGDKMMRMIRADGFEFCHDTEVDPPEAWRDHPHQYRTFISVPVQTNKVVYGLLTIDAPSPGDLDDERDRPLLAVLARLLAATRPYDASFARRTTEFMRQSDDSETHTKT